MSNARRLRRRIEDSDRARQVAERLYAERLSGRLRCDRCDDLIDIDARSHSLQIGHRGPVIVSCHRCWPLLEAIVRGGE